MNSILVKEESAGRMIGACVSLPSLWAPRFILESAWLEHAPFAFWLTERLRPHHFVELGSHNGFSYLAFCQAVQALGLGTRCTAIDTWEGDEHAGFYGDDVYNRLKDIKEKNFPQNTSLIRARFDEALESFVDQEIDLLHVDGRHYYEDVLEDYTSWLPKLAPGGIVLFHDTQVRERNFGVWKLWSELSGKHPSFEFTHGNGLGVLCPVGSPSPALKALFDATEEEVVIIRKFYEKLGWVVSLQAQKKKMEEDVAYVKKSMIWKVLSSYYSIEASVSHAARKVRGIPSKKRRRPLSL